MLTWLLIFILNLLLDIVYAKYTIEVQARRAGQAGLWASGIILTGGISILLYTQTPILLIPAALGALVGTYFTVKHERDK